MPRSVNFEGRVPCLFLVFVSRIILFTSVIVLCIEQLMKEMTEKSELQEQFSQTRSLCEQLTQDKLDKNAEIKRSKMIPPLFAHY